MKKLLAISDIESIVAGNDNKLIIVTKSIIARNQAALQNDFVVVKKSETFVSESSIAFDYREGVISFQTK